MLRVFVRLTVVLCVLYSAVVFLLTFDTPQRMLLFLHWVKFPMNPKYDLPEYYGFGYNSVKNFKIQTPDNVTIGAWHILPESYDKLEQDSFDKALKKNHVFVYFHGNAMHRASPWRIQFYKTLSAKFKESNIIAIDYRGYGDSESSPTESGLRIDAQATLNWLNNKQVTNDRITLIGHSLGTGVATTLAHDMTKAGSPPNSLILQAGYSSVATLVFEYNVLPFIPLLTPLTYFPVLHEWTLSKLNHRFDSLSKIKGVECPILIIYGSKDWEIPVLNSHRLFHRAITQEEEYKDIESLVDSVSTRTVVGNGAIIYRNIRGPFKIHMVQVNYADHNNLGYFDIAYESIREITQ